MPIAHDWFIDLRAHSHGGPVGTLKITDGQGGLYSVADLRSAINGQDVLLMAHGYNVNRPNGVVSLNNFKAALAAPAPFFIGILWPGDCILPIFIDYVWEGGEANKSGDLLGQFVASQLAPVALSISYASHSLGARVVLRALAAMGKGAKVRQAVLMAAAVENNSLTADFDNAADAVEHISVVASRKDYVLELAYPPGNLVGSLFDEDSPNLKAALGRSGPTQNRDNLWPTAKLPDSWNYGHLDYLSHDPMAGVIPETDTVPDPASTSKWPANLPVALETAKWKPCWSPSFLSSRWHKS